MREFKRKGAIESNYFYLIMNDGEGSENIEKNYDKKFYLTLFFSTRKTMIIHNPLQLSPFPYQLFYEDKTTN